MWFGFGRILVFFSSPWSEFISFWLYENSAYSWALDATLWKCFKLQSNRSSHVWSFMVRFVWNAFSWRSLALIRCRTSRSITKKHKYSCGIRKSFIRFAWLLAHNFRNVFKPKHFSNKCVKRLDGERGVDRKKAHGEREHTHTHTDKSGDKRTQTTSFYSYKWSSAIVARRRLTRLAHCAFMYLWNVKYTAHT